MRVEPAELHSDREAITPEEDLVRLRDAAARCFHAAYEWIEPRCCSPSTVLEPPFPIDG